MNNTELVQSYRQQISNVVNQANLQLFWNMYNRCGCPHPPQGAQSRQRHPSACRCTERVASWQGCGFLRAEGRRGSTDSSHWFLLFAGWRIVSPCSPLQDWVLSPAQQKVRLGCGLPTVLCASPWKALRQR